MVLTFNMEFAPGVDVTVGVELIFGVGVLVGAGLAVRVGLIFGVGVLVGAGLAVLVGLIFGVGVLVGAGLAVRVGLIFGVGVLVGAGLAVGLTVGVGLAFRPWTLLFPADFVVLISPRDRACPSEIPATNIREKASVIEIAHLLAPPARGKCDTRGRTDRQRIFW
jgi:hypothetical protein